MKYLIFYNPSRTNSTGVVRSIMHALMRVGESFSLSTGNDDFDRDAEGHVLVRDGVARCEMIITVGGDGTMLAISKLASEADKPVLGINSGNLGFLTAIEAGESENITDILSGGSLVENRHYFLSCRVNGGEERFCLNDMVVSRNMMSNSVNLMIESGGAQLMRFSGDGIIVSTSTGSTAYSLSVGGPIVDVDLEAVIVSPVAPHTLNRTSIVLRRDKALTVTVRDTGDNGPYVSFDGQDHTLLGKGDRIDVCLSERYVRILSLGEFGQFQKVDKKLKSR